MVNSVKDRYNLQPQEMDVILWLAGKEDLGTDEPEISFSGSFSGFTPDTFDFLSELKQSNTLEWMSHNKERYHRVLREPLRALFSELAPVMAGLDPNLETAVKAGKVLAKINKRFPDAEGPYHTHLWGAFYRAGRTKQNDAQLY